MLQTFPELDLIPSTHLLHYASKMILSCLHRHPTCCNIATIKSFTEILI
jgi:hypothetical protein